MVEGGEKKFVCGFCDRAFATKQARGGHVWIHYSNQKNSVDSDRSNGNNKKRSMGRQREKQKQQQVCCTICSKNFVSLKALEDHMACHSERDAMLLDSQSETTRKRSKRVMERSNSESFSNEILSFGSGISHDVGVASYILMMMKSEEYYSSYEERHNFVMNSMHEDDFEVVKTKYSSSGKKLITISYVNKSQVSEKDKVADGDQLRSSDGVILCGSHGSDSDADISVHGSRRNTGFGSGLNNSTKRFRDGDEGGSKYETDSGADTNSKIHRSGDSKSPVVKKAGGEEKESKSHECPICSEVFKSVEALDCHVRSHYIENREHNQVAERPNKIDVRLVEYSDTDDE
ncbi:PREDICTED: uncharacterized protein LOC104759425 [Camelina sativa]|uniref:Uncharacterized protein LOC104759425 n=1 Tax=Camelina sativa TaxID=90675 RepID=A0ABM0X4S2_CAMSA|nr:PREDICTED: uncharacterized protein LOC104759425 [Camelina sativa]